MEERCRRFYAPKLGRPGWAPGMYFRLLLIGYFEGIDSERGMAWRANDSLALRRFLRVGLDESAPGSRRLVPALGHIRIRCQIAQECKELWRLADEKPHVCQELGRARGGSRGVGGANDRASR